MGASGRDVHLGAFGTTFNAYGLIIEGAVSGNGAFDGASGTALQIGVAGGTVHIDGGVRVVGPVTSQGFEADSTAVHVLAGASAPALQNESSITADATSAKATSATAVLLEPGASVSTLNNTGAISGVMTGDLGSASAVVDRSGALSNVTNTNLIIAVVKPANLGDATAGHTTALDLSQNTTGVTLVQNPNPKSTTAAPITPTIQGDILLGSGNDTVQFNAGNVTGALSFGAGADSLLIGGGAVFRGALTSTGILSVNVANGVLEDDSATVIKTSSLTIGASSQLILSADPARNASTQFVVSGPATIASGAVLGLHLLSLPTAPVSYTVISSPQLTSAVSDTDLSGQTPYLFVAGFHADPTAGTVTVNLRRRTAAEASLNRGEAEALDPVYNNLSADPGIQRAFLSQTTQPGLVSVLDQMAPDYAGGVFRALSWASESQGVAAGDPPLDQQQAGPTRAWTQEIVEHETKSRDQASGYSLLGFGIIGGLESVSAKGHALGVRFGFTTADVRDPNLPSDNLEGVSQISTGVYWRGSIGALQADAQLGAGYVWIYNRREFLFSDSAGVVHDTAGGRWGGYTLSGRFGVAYNAEMGNFFVEPRLHADYFRMHESGYNETGGGSGFDLSVAPRSGDELSVTGTVTAGATFGEGFRWRPQIEVGYRDVLTGSAGVTTARYAGGAPFALTAESIRRGALIGRVGLRIYSDYLDLLLDAGAQFADDYTDLDVHLTARTVF